MKNYATETDIITTPDPVFYPGDLVEYSENDTPYNVTVESHSWNDRKKSWTYTLVYFLTEGDGSDRRWNGSLAYDEAFEKDLKLVSRQRKN